MLSVVTGLTLAASVLVSVPATAETTAKAESVTGAPAVVWDEQAQAQRQVSPAEAKRIVEEYWTPERLASAVPADRPAGTTGRKDPTPAPSAQPRDIASPVPPVDGGEVSTRDAWFSNTNGKVYFRHPRTGETKSCSGGAVNSDSKRVVVTAGHCVHTGGGDGAVMQNWIFIPGYEHGAEPLGQFAAYWFWLSTGWTVDFDWQRDFAFVVTYDNGSGQRVVDAAGGHGLRVNGGYNRFVHIAGYPGNKDGGEVQWYCWGTTDQWPGASAYRLGCDFGGGISGGPWLEDYEPNGLGYVISATQGLLERNNSGPYYDDHTLDIYNLAKDMTP